MVAYAQPAIHSFSAEKPRTQAGRFRRGHMRVRLTIHSTQLRKQAWLKTQLPRQHSQPHTSTKILAATSNPVANSEAAAAAFREAGIPDEVTTKVLKQYPYYQRWDIDTKLRPALKLWVNQLGSQQLSARFERIPRLLLRTPEESSDIYLWLASVGVDAEKIQKQVPRVMTRQLSQVKSIVWAMQELLQLTDEQLPALFSQHKYCLLRTPEYAGQTLNTLAELLQVPVASPEMLGVLMASDHNLFMMNPALIHERISFFCDEFGGGQDMAKRALKQGILCVPVELMESRAAELKLRFGWPEHELNKILHIQPRLLTHKPSTVANNIQKFQAHNFSLAQAMHIYASVPGIAGYDWDSAANREKLTYLKLILQLSSAELTSFCVLLGTSLERRLGPRSEFMYRCRDIHPDVPVGLSGCSSYLQAVSDAKFAAKFDDLSASPPLIYDAVFRQHWQDRWTFLRQNMALSVADISACRALLFTSLPNTLAPRWHALTLLEAAKAGFKATDHLTALATLSDEHFAQEFNSESVGLLYDQVD
ncbi:hypothetical protein ABBQ32_008058 [Trebouxia sp. C0010 RCD-2024]